MIDLEDIIIINKKFSNGNLVNKASLEFALSSLKETKDWVKQLAILIRAILIDHPFEEGNKRTAIALLGNQIESHRLAYDPYKADKVLFRIAKENINNIEKIRRMIKDVIR